MTSTSTLQSSSTRRSPLRSLIGVWCVVVAGLPVAATEFGLVPIHESQRRMLPACAAFFCILGFAYVFSLRHQLARVMFGGLLLWSEGPAPVPRRTWRASINQVLACVILGSIAAAAIYLWEFETSRGLPTFPALPRSSAAAVVLALSYIAMFVLAETAFAIMAVREYLQDVLALSEAEVITGVPKGTLEYADDSPLDSDPSLTYEVTAPHAPGDPVQQFKMEHAAAHQPGLLRKIRLTMTKR